MKIKTHKDELLDLIPETEEETMLLEILCKKEVGIANVGWTDGTLTNLCLIFRVIKNKKGGKN